MRETSDKRFRIAVLWAGDRAARDSTRPQDTRYNRIFDELATVGIKAEPAVYGDAMVAEVREQLRHVDGVLVWVNPIFDGGNRAMLDAMLRDVASTGVWVSAHPDVILKMGTKEILHRTKHLSWGSDTRIYRTFAELCDMLPRLLESEGPRVLKRNRGNGGQGVWKVERLESATIREARVRVLEATRGSVPQDLPLEAFLQRCSSYFESDGGVVDQPFQPRLSDGMIRCYMGADKVIGFGHQLIKALVTPPAGGPAPESGPRIMHDASAPAFQALRTRMETEWVPQMITTLKIDSTALPIVWDADFLYGPRTMSSDDTYVLCEINVSSVFPVPDAAPPAIAELCLQRCMRVRPR